MSTNQKRITYSKLWSKISKPCRFKGCVFPDKTKCSKNTIKAHSIQKSKILNYIAENGMVMSPNVRKIFDNIEFDEVGVKSASTFFGFCGNHDNSIFAEIENNNYNNSDEHNFFYAYRACALEYVKKRESLCRLSELIKRFGNILHLLSLGPAFFETEQAVKDITNFLNKFSTELLRPKQSRNFNIIETKIFELSFESLIAVNSLLYIIYDFQGNLINDLTNFSKTPAPIFLNVFPQAGKTFILFSWLLNDSKIYQGIISELNSYSNSQIELFFSNRIIEHCENLFMSPLKYKRISIKKRKLLVSKFMETSDKPPNPNCLTQNIPINLFRLMEK